jgi:hypothetical protein
MAAVVLQRQACPRAARARVAFGRPLAGQVWQEHQAVRARRHAGGLGEQRLVRRVLASNVPGEPVERHA